MSNPPTIKIGVIGAGYLGEFHIQQLQTIKNVKLVGFHDSNLDRSKTINSKYNVQGYNSYSDLYEICDAIIIATPTGTHYQIAKNVLENGCHVFIEKPITEKLKQAQELIKEAAKRNLLIQVGHIERFNPAFILLNNMNITPKFIEVHRLASFKSRGQDTSVVLDLMIHDIDIILSILKSEITDVQANGVSVITSETDIANARITFRNKCIVNLTASRISLKEMRKMRIFQNKSYINIDFLNKNMEEYLLIDKQKVNKNSELFPYDDKGNKFIQYTKNDGKQHNALQEELKHFITSIQNNTQPIINGEIAKEALNIALIIQEKING